MFRTPHGAINKTSTHLGLCTGLPATLSAEWSVVNLYNRKFLVCRVHGALLHYSLISSSLVTHVHPPYTPEYVWTRQKCSAMLLTMKPLFKSNVSETAERTSSHCDKTDVASSAFVYSPTTGEIERLPDCILKCILSEPWVDYTGLLKNLGATENAGVENAPPSKMQRWKTREWKTWHHLKRHLELK